MAAQHPPIDVRRDLAGLRIAADELYEESYQGKELASLLEGMPVHEVPAEQIHACIRSVMPKRSVAHGYFQWALYLLWLRQFVEMPGVHLELSPTEAEGILVIRAAENNFRAQHPPCWKCGALNIRDVSMCRECGAEFRD